MSDTGGIPGWAKGLIAVLVGATLFVFAAGVLVWQLSGQPAGDSAVASSGATVVPNAPSPPSAPAPVPGAPTPQAPAPQSPAPQSPGTVPFPGVPGGIPLPPFPANLPFPSLPQPAPPGGSAPAPSVPPQDLLSPMAREVDVPGAWSYAQNDPYCQRPPLISDLFKEIAFQTQDALRSGLHITVEEEVRIGNQMLAELRTAPDSPYRGRVDANPAVAAYLTAIAQEFFPHLERTGMPYQVHVIDDPTENAFATPGGHIYVFTGLFQNRSRIQNEAQLAGIIAHEIGHIDRRHSTAVFEVLAEVGARGTPAEIPMQVIVSMVQHPFSTEFEDDADRYAVERLFRTQYSPYQFELLWRNWDALDQGADGVLGQIPGGGQGGDPLGQFLGQLGEELENVLLSHSLHSARACSTRTEIARLLPSYPLGRFYVGTSNLARQIPRAMQQF